MDKFAKQNEVLKLSGCCGVDDADIWDESYSLTAGGLTDVWMFFSEARSNACRKKSAEDIVPNHSLVWEGLNLILSE
jgi:hypothetical protein